MATVVYPAIATGDRTAGYSATFPDLPGCTATGRDLSDLLSQARDALRDHLTGLSQGDQDWPDATPLEDVSPGSGTLLAVDVTLEETPVRVNISIGERLLKRIDAAAEARGMTRSGFIASAARRALGEGPQSWNNTEWEAAARRVQEELNNVGRKVNENLGPDSIFARNMAELDDKISEVIRKTADNVAAAIRRRQERQAHAPQDPPAPPPPTTPPPTGPAVDA